MTRTVAGPRRQGAKESLKTSTTPRMNAPLRADLQNFVAELGADASHAPFVPVFDLLASGQSFTAQIDGPREARGLLLRSRTGEASLAVTETDMRRWLAIALTVVDEWAFSTSLPVGDHPAETIDSDAWVRLAERLAKELGVKELAYGKRDSAAAAREIVYFAGCATGEVAFSRDYVDAVAAFVTRDRIATVGSALDAIIAHMDACPWRGVFYEDVLLELRRASVRAPLDVRERLQEALENYVHEAVMGRPKSAQQADWRTRHREVIGEMARDPAVNALPLAARLKLSIDLQGDVQRALFSDGEMGAGLAHVEETWEPAEVWRSKRPDETAVEFYERVYVPIAKEERPYAHQLRRADESLYKALQAAIANNLRRHTPGGPMAGARGLADLFPTARRTDDLPSPSRAVALIARRREAAKRNKEKHKRE